MFKRYLSAILLLAFISSAHADPLPPYEKLNPYWKNFFSAVDSAVAENFWGNLSILKRALRHHDPYISQLKEMGYQFEKGREKPASFYDSIQWTLKELDNLVVTQQLSTHETLTPAKAFVLSKDGEKTYHFIPFGKEVPKNAQELNLLNPDTFVDMLSKGFFPISEPIREHTNQTLAEHDLAHIAGFVSHPNYMKAIRHAFQQIQIKLITTPKIKEALSNFDSLYSLRLYYMIEVFSIIPNEHKQKLETLLELKIADFSLDQAEKIYPKVVQHLEKKNPQELGQYLFRLYDEFLGLVNPVGGESRDILNRTRKFSRANQMGSFYSTMSNLGSKFDGSSIYSMYQNALAALENKRSNHSDYANSIRLIHAPLLATMIGTSQLTVEDWVYEGIKEVIDKDSKLYNYLCKTGLWTKAHVLYWAYCTDDYSKVLKADEMVDPQ